MRLCPRCCWLRSGHWREWARRTAGRRRRLLLHTPTLGRAGAPDRRRLAADGSTRGASWLAGAGARDGVHLLRRGSIGGRRQACRRRSERRGWFPALRLDSGAGWLAGAGARDGAHLLRRGSRRASLPRRLGCLADRGRDRCRRRAQSRADAPDRRSDGERHRESFGAATSFSSDL
eukprot:SAG22_NODE_1446_length_4405_cov_1.853460_4_plen_176_part_00